MAETRIDREQEDRAAEAREPAWKPPQHLPDPNPREGFKHKWIRVTMVGDADATNVSSKLREGWRPCKAKDYPEITMVATEVDAFKENVVIGGLMLCCAPVEMVNERNAYYQGQAQAQMDTVNENYMREDHPSMKKFKEHSSRTTFGRGK